MNTLSYTRTYLVTDITNSDSVFQTIATPCSLTAALLLFHQSGGRLVNIHVFKTFTLHLLAVVAFFLYSYELSLFSTCQFYGFSSKFSFNVMPFELVILTSVMGITHYQSLIMIKAKDLFSWFVPHVSYRSSNLLVYHNNFYLQHWCDHNTWPNATSDHSEIQ